MSLESYILPLLLVLFVIYKIYKMNAIKKQLPGLLQAGAIIIDVRSPSEFKGAHNPNSINIPLDEIKTKANTLDKNKSYVLCCASGARSGAALGILKALGFKNVFNAGSWFNTMTK